MKNRFLTARDYAILFERASCILDREITKPTEEMDDDLIYELEETMLYCAERKKALLHERMSFGDGRANVGNAVETLFP